VQARRPKKRKKGNKRSGSVKPVRNSISTRIENNEEGKRSY
jgi:hypothetical protein